MSLVPDIAPEIYRQRLLVEGRFTCELDAGAVSDFLLGLAGALGLRTYGDPIVYSPDSAIAEGRGQAENAGYDAFVPLVDSGIAYFACSLLPWKKSYLCAVDAKTGEPTGKGRFVRELDAVTARSGDFEHTPPGGAVLPEGVGKGCRSGALRGSSSGDGRGAPRPRSGAHLGGSNPAG